jgi:zinc and cadmium transporter
VLVHELPEEIADYALLRAAGMTKRTALAGLAVVQLTAGIGAVGTLAATSLLARANGPILAVASGLFVYISAFDLVPELVRARSLSGLVAGVIGVAIVLGLS